MAILEEVNIGAIKGDAPEQQIEQVVKQINEQTRIISNEGRTKLYKDEAGDNRIIIGQLPDGTHGLVISKEGTDVVNVFD